MTPEAMQALLSWDPVSPRILMARFNSKGRRVTIIQCSVPTNALSAEDKEEFYNQLQATIDRVPKRDLRIVMGDMNTQVGADNTEKEQIMGKYGMGEFYENGEFFTDFSAFNELVIGGTVCPHFSPIVICEFVGLYIPHQLKSKISINIGLNRNDGLAVLKGNNRSADNIRKNIKQLIR